jgi:imidazole glycerol phosphate synthase subunit HisF
MRSVADARRMLHAGADRIAFNTAAVERPELIAAAAAAVGSQSVVAAVDARRRDPSDPSTGWEVTVHGGRTATGIDALTWCVRTAELGAGEILLTSMDQDGTKSGFDLELLRAVTAAVYYWSAEKSIAGLGTDTETFSAPIDWHVNSRRLRAAGLARAGKSVSYPRASSVRYTSIPAVI